MANLEYLRKSLFHPMQLPPSTCPLESKSARMNLASSLQMENVPVLPFGSLTQTLLV